MLAQSGVGVKEQKTNGGGGGGGGLSVRVWSASRARAANRPRPRCTPVKAEAVWRKDADAVGTVVREREVGGDGQRRHDHPACQRQRRDLSPRPGRAHGRSCQFKPRKPPARPGRRYWHRSGGSQSRGQAMGGGGGGGGGRVGSWRQYDSSGGGSGPSFVRSTAKPALPRAPVHCESLSTGCWY